MCRSSQRLLSALECANGKRSKIHISDSSAETKPQTIRDGEVLDFDVLEDFNSVRPAVTALSSATTSQSARGHVPVFDPHDFRDGFLPTQVLVAFPKLEMGTTRGAAALSTTSGETSSSNVSEKLRSQWSGADFATCDSHGERRGHC